MSNKYIVITSIYPPTAAIEVFSQFSDWKVIVVGDKKTNPDWSYPNVQFVSVCDQEKLNSPFVDAIPWNSYTRKNIGYALAISNGADIIYETDDDNIPKDNWVNNPLFNVAVGVLHKPGFVNIYSYFSEKHVWPRGLPLQYVLQPKLDSPVPKQSKIGVLQFLADGDPDVDAIYRLTNNTPIYFNKRNSLVLDKGVCCPFNSQNTYFRHEVFPLLYLPSTVTFRFTDILRGLIAQPILWAADYRLGFGEATVLQERNPHDYLKDFESEIPGYLLAEKVVMLADKHVSPSYSIAENMISVYSALQREGIVTHYEIELLQLWLNIFSE